MENKIKIVNKDIIIIIPAANSGKFRFKKRKDNLDFGETFSTRKLPFDEQTYLEWQIGYDATLNDIKKGEKKTKLKGKSFLFIGANKQKKYPYELSEIFFEAIKIKLLLKEDVENLLNEIGNYKNFIDEKNITIEKLSEFEINGIKFYETSIKLPTLSITNTDNTQIEISIEKQQYATGVQPMVYFCIPFKSFDNCEKLSGKPSTSKDNLIYKINENNVSNLLFLMRIFGMASKRHHHDIIEILKIFIKNING